MAEDWGAGAFAAPTNFTSGGAGGGAILIASAQTISIEGAVDALGGRGGNGDNRSGGAIRLVADEVTGAGQMTAVELTASPIRSGRIRIDTNSLSPALQTFPKTIGVPPADPPVRWPAANAPTARVVSVDAVNAPLDPRAPLVAAADVAIQNSNQVAILVETTSFPIEGVVQFNVMPKLGNRTTLHAMRLRGDITSATWRLKTTLPQGFVTLQARATQP